MLYNFSHDSQGSVHVLVRDVSGERTVQYLHVSNGTLTADPTVDPSTVTTTSTRLFRLSDGSVITLSNVGVSMRKGSSKGELSVLIASPTPPPMRTPLAVWGDGARIAWVSPTDHSVQVFQRNSRGVYIPIWISEKPANSIAFTEDGTELVMAFIQSVDSSDRGQTSFEAVSLDTKAERSITTITGLATVF